MEPAKRSSKNRPAGTLETKAILSVTKEVTRKWLIEMVLPAITRKWPQGNNDPIFIQWDNAKPHITGEDAEFKEAVKQTGKDIRLCFQPPNSPDLNVLDLGFFRAIQSLQEQQSIGNIDDLIDAVESSFHNMPAHDLNKVFLTLQCVMKQIMAVGGGNDYKLPHMCKDSLHRQGRMPGEIECEQRLMDDVCMYLNNGE